MKNINKFSLFLILTLVFVGSFAEYKIAEAATGGGTATIAVDGGAPSSGVTVVRGTSHTFTTILTIPTGGMTLGATSPTFTIPDGFTAPNNHAVATIGEVNTDGMWSATTTGAGCTVSSDPASITSSSTGQIITIDIIGNCAVNDTISLTYKGTPNVTMGATRLVVSTVIAGDTSPVEALNVAPYSPTITVTHAANIVVASAKITSSSTVLVTMVSAGQALLSTSPSSWHIDVNNTGAGSLIPISANAPGNQTEITLTFSGTPFASTSKTYDAAHGLYVDASGVTNAVGDTNVVVVDTSSTAITDGQPPTFVSAIATSDTNVQLTFSEPITIFHATDFKIDIPEYTGNGDQGRGTFAARDGSDYTKVNVTVISLNNTAYTSTNLDILVDAVKDLSPAANGIIESLNNNILDGQAPTITSVTPLTGTSISSTGIVGFTLSEYALSTITFTWMSGSTDPQGGHLYLVLAPSTGALTFSIATLNSDATFALINPLVNGAVYKIDINAWDAVNNSAAQNETLSVTYNNIALSYRRHVVTDYSTTTLVDLTIASQSSSTTTIASSTTPIIPIVLIITNTSTAGKTPYQFSFTQILKLGSIGDEVKQLQIFLNAHGFTVSKTGYGSTGKETTYFGQKTKDALIKFQETNAKDVLIPQDLIKGTGIFLNYSKKLINQILLSGN